MVYNILLLYYNVTSIYWYAVDIYTQLSKYENCSISLKHMRFVSRDTLLEYAAIIPIDVTSQIFYNSLKISPFYTTTPNMYSLLNNKSDCYHITKNYKHIQHIPTLDVFTKALIKGFIKSHPSDKYIIKHNTGYASFFQIIVTKSKLTHINLKSLQGHIIQPYYTNYKVYSLDVVAHSGKIYGEIFKKTLGRNGINYIDFIISSIDTTIIKDGPLYRPIKAFSKSLLSDINYSGICELEFIVTNDNMIYFLEINTRISGHIGQINKYGQNAYFNNIIIPHLSFYNIALPPQIMLSNNYTGSSLRHLLPRIYAINPALFISIAIIYYYISFIVIKKLYNLYSSKR